jgi:hypothetical protein
MSSDAPFIRAEGAAPSANLTAQVGVQVIKQMRAASIIPLAAVIALAGCAGNHTDRRAVTAGAARDAAGGHFGTAGLVPDTLSAHVVQAMRDRVSRGAWPRTDFARHVVPLDDFLPGGPPRDGIPPLDHPRVAPASAADRYLPQNEPVLAVSVRGRARAYPIRIMIWHEIANDMLGGRPIAVTYCPLCNSGVAFDRRVHGRALRFGTTGLLRRSDLVMWDRQTESWWQQLDGHALVGRLAGRRLRMLPAETLSWRDFKRRYPRGDALAQATGYQRPYGQNPYFRYDTGSGPFGFNGGPIDKRLPPMERVLAVRAGRMIVAAPYSLLRRRPVVNTRIGRVAVVILFERQVVSPLDATRIESSRDVGTAVAFDRRIGHRELSFGESRGRVVDRQTGSVWDISGGAIAGPLRGRTLRPVVQNTQFWFALSTFAPGARVLGVAH